VIEHSAEGRLYNSVDSLPHNHVGLLLGTSKYLRGGSINPYYQYRIDATVRLIRSGKIDYLVISGDNSRKSYNEPQMMKTDLASRGIDSIIIFLDYAGFRTFDSMVRLREIFSQDSVTIISQKFHNERALFIASKERISAVAINARDVPASIDFKTRVREKLARVKVFVDYFLSNEPKFLGEKVLIPGN
jgi:SanA protein